MVRYKCLTLASITVQSSDIVLGKVGLCLCGYHMRVFSRMLVGVFDVQLA